MAKICVLLSTYNGEKYLAEQLNSIYAQEGIDFHVLVRDDGSVDNTVSILNKYLIQYGRMTVLAEKNVGAATSFYILMKYAYEHFSDYDYYCFSDQDDVWFPFKLSSGVDDLALKNSLYKLYFSSATIVDSELNKCGEFKFPDKFNYKTSIYRNPVLGCTMIFNYALLEKSLVILKYIESSSCDKKYLPLHDAWMFLCACYLDAYIVGNSASTMLYRQHGSNVTTYNKGFIRRFKLAFKRILYKPNRHSYVAGLLLLLENEMSEDKKIYLNKCVNYRTSIKDTVSFLKIIDLSEASFVDSLLWIVCVLFRKF